MQVKHVAHVIYSFNISCFHPLSSQERFVVHLLWAWNSTQTYQGEWPPPFYRFKMVSKRLTFLPKIACLLNDKLGIWIQVYTNPGVMHNPLIHKPFQVLKLKWKGEEGLGESPPTHSSENRLKREQNNPSSFERPSITAMPSQTMSIFKNLYWLSSPFYHI